MIVATIRSAFARETPESALSRSRVQTLHSFSTPARHWQPGFLAFSRGFSALILALSDDDECGLGSNIVAQLQHSPQVLTMECHEPNMFFQGWLVLSSPTCCLQTPNATLLVCNHVIPNASLVAALFPRREEAQYPLGLSPPNGSRTSTKPSLRKQHHCPRYDDL